VFIIRQILRTHMNGNFGRWFAILGIIALAGCSGTGTTTTGDSSSSAYQKALVYSQCMRAHGVPSYPDPNSQGQFIIPNGSNDPTSNVSTAVANAALKACQSLEPPSLAQGPSGSQGQGTNTSGELKFAECMRSHGEPDFPDPLSDGQFTLPAGMNAESPQFQAAGKACQSLMPNNPSGQGAS
jgi:hypothetical protein